MVVVVKAVRSSIPPGWVRSLVTRAAEVPEVAARLPAGDWELVVKISGDRELRRLNRRFLDEDHPTDVLSFPTGERSVAANLGDIVLSLPAARRQGGEFGHGEKAELGLLVVHGFLHLLGWDHASEVEESEMNRLTLAALLRSRVEIAKRRLLQAELRG